MCGQTLLFIVIANCAIAPNRRLSHLQALAIPRGGRRAEVEKTSRTGREQRSSAVVDIKRIRHPLLEYNSVVLSLHLKQDHGLETRVHFVQVLVSVSRPEVQLRSRSRDLKKVSTTRLVASMPIRY